VTHRIALSRRTLLASAAAAAATWSVGKPDSARAQTFDRDALIAGAKKEGNLVWYATTGEDQINQALKRFKAEYPFIDTSGTVRASSGRLKARLDSEIATSRVLGDALQMGSFGQFLNYAKAGALDGFETPEMNAFPASFKQQGLWTVFRNSPVLIAYNSQKVTEADAPKSWAALLDPKYQGKIALLDSTTGGQHVHWHVLRDKLGPDYWAKLADNKPVIVSSPNAVIDGLLTGDFAFACHAYGYTVVEYQRNGAPIKAIIPSDGVPILVSPIGVLKGGPNPNAARLFVDWILSKKGQTAIVEIMNDYSPRSDVPAPAGLPAWDNLNKLVPPNWDAFAATTGEFGKDWEKLQAKK